NLGIVIERTGAGVHVDDDVAIDPEDLLEELIAEAVHHGHDDDQRRYAEQDAYERKPRDDRDEALLAPGPEIAKRQHPLEGRERTGVDGLAHALYPCSCSRPRQRQPPARQPRVS